MSGHQKIKPNAEFSVMEQSRATPLRPAIWMTGVLVWATVIALFFHVPTWAGIFLCSLTGLSFLHYLASYSYLLLYDREALRRERYRVKGRGVLERGSLESTSGALMGDQAQSARVETPSLMSEEGAVVRHGDV